MKNKYCRICWNTDGWRKPSGAANETGNSYVAQNGFGHEEWLFNYEWCLNGYKYGFLQPINKYRDTFEGETFSATLYAKTQSFTLLVATINTVYVPPLEELRHAFRQMISRGWLNQMREDVTAVGGQLADLENPTPHLVINVRFKPDDVVFHDPMPDFPLDHKISKLHRYQAYDWDHSNISVLDHAPVRSHDDPTRSELPQLRAAQQATTVDPKHVRLQNRLYHTLCKRYGNGAVAYEQDFVDLKVLVPGTSIFIEIKTDPSARTCIRNAIGQLLEYSMYPPAKRADQLVVVGDAPANADDLAYLQHLRSQYSLPIFYAQFFWENNDIGDFL